MARPRYTTRFTTRLEPELRDRLQSQADANGDDFATHVRTILAVHAGMLKPKAWPRTKEDRNDR